MNKWTLYICRDLNSPHYQMPINEVKDKIMTMNTIPQLYILGGSNSFIHSVFHYNEMNISDSFTNSLIKLIKSNYDKKSKAKPRQRMFLDFGFTTNISTSRCSDTMNGISKPLLKPGSTLPLIVKCFSILSYVAKNQQCPWIFDSHIYTDDRFPDRFPEFSQRIHNTNIVEAIRIALVDCNNLCSIHEDKHNDPYPKMSSVLSLGKIIHQDDGRVSRLSIIGYSRKSISDYYLRKKKLLPTINRLLSHHLMQENKLAYIFVTKYTGYIVKQSFAYLQPFERMNRPLNIIISFIARYRLCYIQVVSIIQAYILTYSDARIFCQAAQYLLHSSATSTCNITCFHDMGFHIITLIKGKNEKCKTLYGSITKNYYNRLVSLLCCHFFNLFKHTSYQSSRKKSLSLVIGVKKDIETMYNAYNVFTSDCPFLVISAIIGLVPFWTMYEREIIPKETQFESLLKLDKTIYNKTTCTQIIESVRYIISQKQGRVVNTPYLLCLIDDYVLKYDMPNQSERYSYVKYQALRYIFSINAHGMVVNDRKNNLRISFNTPFMYYWPYQAELRPMKSILGAFHIETFNNVNDKLFNLNAFSHLFSMLRWNGKGSIVVGWKKK